MGSPARLRVRAISLTEAGIIVESCKRMFKEDLRRAKMELRKRVSSTQHASVLSATTGTFEPAATSSGLVPGGHGLPAAGHGAPMPTLTADDEGTITDASTQSRRPRRHGRGRRLGRETDGAETDASASSTNTGTRSFKKRSGVSNKVEFRNLEARKDILMMSWRPSGAGKGALVTRGTTMRTSSSYLTCTRLSLETPLRSTIGWCGLSEPLMVK